jgi:hypothetical protein
MRACSVVCLALGLVLPPLAARGDLAGHFGGNPRSMGLGGAYTAVAEDLAALYYNPAGLVRLQGMSVAAGVLVAQPALGEDGDSLSMPDERSWYLGVGVPFSGKLKDRLALGLSLNVPFGRVFHAKLYRKQDPYFLLYDASVRLLQLRFGAAVRPPWKPLSFLSFGAAVQVLSSFNGFIGFFAPFQQGATAAAAADPDARLEANLDMDVPTEAFATVGMMAELGQHLRLGVNYRSAQFIEVRFPISFATRLVLPGGNQINLPVEALASFRAKYHPQQVMMGASYQRGRWLVAFDLNWIDYSAYEIPYARITLDIDRLSQDPGVRLLLGEDATLLDPLEPQIELRDVLVPRLGCEVRLLDWLTARLGYFFEVSPLVSTDLPIYDTDKHGWSLGARASFVRPLDLVPGRLNIDLGLEEILYRGRSVLGSDVGGHVFALFAGVEVVLL